MTADEIAAKLKELGLNTNAWQETTAGSRPSPMIENQKKALAAVRDLLEQQVKQDQAQLVELHEKANRLRHGGGS